MKTIETMPVLRPGSDEWRLLMLAVRLHPETDDLAEMQRLAARELDWDLLVSHAIAHGIGGLVYRNLSRLDDGAIPVEVVERLKNVYLMVTAMEMQHHLQLKRLADSLKETGVEVMALKGAALAESLYGEPGLRTMSDVDLLVRERDWPEIRRALDSIGFRPAGKDFSEAPPKLTRYDTPAHIQYISESGTCLEFQFDLFTLGIGMRDIEGVWRRSRPLTLAGAQVRVPGPEDQLLHLAIHANRHGCTRLKWLVDIAETLSQSEEIDWDLMVDIAAREGVKASAYPTLLHVQKLFGRRLADPEQLERLKPRAYQLALWRKVWPQRVLDRFAGRYEDAVGFYYFRFFSGWNIVNFMMMGRVSDKMAYQLRWIVPPIAWMKVTYGQQKYLSLAKYYFLRMLNYRKEKHEQ